MFEISEALRELYVAGLRPEDVVMPCECGGCGTLPAMFAGAAWSATCGTRLSTTTTVEPLTVASESVARRSPSPLRHE
jgi:hypothetical protein